MGDRDKTKDDVASDFMSDVRLACEIFLARKRKFLVAIFLGFRYF